MKRRIGEHFRAVGSNDDVVKYASAIRVLEGEHAWLEEGLTPAEAVPASEASGQPRVARR